jgi:hypothetical protein
VDISNYQPERRIYKGYQKDLTLRNNKKTLRTAPFSAKDDAIHSGISLGLSVILACPESFRKRRIPDSRNPECFRDRDCGNDSRFMSLSIKYLLKVNTFGISGLCLCLPEVLLYMHYSSAIAFDWNSTIFLDFDLPAGSKIAQTKGEARKSAAC